LHVCSSVQQMLQFILLQHYFILLHIKPHHWETHCDVWTYTAVFPNPSWRNCNKISVTFWWPGLMPIQYLLLGNCCWFCRACWRGSRKYIWGNPRPPPHMGRRENRGAEGDVWGEVLGVSPNQPSWTAPVADLSRGYKKKVFGATPTPTPNGCAECEHGKRENRGAEDFLTNRRPTVQVNVTLYEWMSTGYIKKATTACNNATTFYYF